jgi:thioredoxin-related protein
LCNLFFSFLFAIFFSHTSVADPLQSRDLSQIAATAHEKSVPILLIVSQHYCPFCELLKEEIIYPTQKSGGYDGKAVIAEILIDSPKEIRDFSGDPVKPAVLAETYQVWVTPTLLFLDHTGREIHKRMLGVNTIELYDYYLDESLTAALQAVRGGDRSYETTHEDVVGDAPGYDQLH